MNRMLSFDAELLERYDLPGPRYTSYPTVPHFTESFCEAQLLGQIHCTNEALPLVPISLYLHIPYCQSPCFYCGCNRVITRDENTVCGTYISATARGRLLMRIIAMCFDRYLPTWPTRSETEQFSKVV